MTIREIRPTDNSKPSGAYIVQLKDKEIPGVYHWVCQCYTMDDAEKIANLLMDSDPDARAFITVSYELKDKRG